MGGLGQRRLVPWRSRVRLQPGRFGRHVRPGADHDIAAWLLVQDGKLGGIKVGAGQACAADRGTARPAIRDRSGLTLALEWHSAAIRWR